MKQKQSNKKAQILVHRRIKTVLFLLVSVFVIVGAGTSSYRIINAQSLQEKIENLQTENAHNRSAVDKLREVATSYEDAIHVLEHDIADTEKAIRVSTDRQTKLEQQIIEVQADLNEQKKLLGTNIRAMYLEGDISTLEMLASSKDLSDFLDKEQYRNAVKDKIVVTLEKINDLKDKLRTQKTQVQAEIKEQRNSRTELASIRGEQARLLAFNESEQSAYNKETKANEAKIQEFQAAQAALASSIASGNFVSQGSVKQGDIVGRVGNTGFSTGAHLHFEARLPSGQDVNPNNYIGNGWIRPVDGGYVSQSYGNPSNWYARGYHMGIDYAGVTGRPVRAAADGEIIWRGCRDSCNTSYGYYVMIRHSNGVLSLYGHMSP